MIQEEQWSVAMEISTKCGLDPSGVWFGWGMVCLQVGDFTAARAKFAKCLKVRHSTLKSNMCTSTCFSATCHFMKYIKLSTFICAICF